MPDKKKTQSQPDGAGKRKVSIEPDGAGDKGAVESETQPISMIKGSEVLGSRGEAREEHSGQNRPRKNPEPTADLADNKPQQMPKKK